MAWFERSNYTQSLRWIGVLPGALVSVVLVTFPMHWVVMLIQIFGGAGYDSFITIDDKNLLAAIPPEILERFGYAFFAPLVMVIIGAKIAPRFKFRIGIALAVLWSVFFAVSMATTISGQYSDWNWLRLTITSVLGMGGVGLGLFQTYQTQKRLR